MGLPETNATMSTSRNAVRFAERPADRCRASSNIGAIAGPATKLAVNIYVSAQFDDRCNRIVSRNRQHLLFLFQLAVWSTENQI
jgi:hypothetical protein